MSEKKSGIGRTLRLIAAGFIVYLFVLPLIPKFWSAAHDLNQIEPNLLIVGLGLQAFSLFAYSKLTQAALGEHGADLPVLRLFRIQLSTKALGNIMPGGSAASTAPIATRAVARRTNMPIRNNAANGPRNMLNMRGSRSKIRSSGCPALK